ncbi:efflux transporter outer membrane subunit [Novosphingobium sp.]|uniref:efflux transporter outer membrane subunit n=1 Tax=Novosphingobium sp. TaxID=1874826 RepID=UPI003B5289F2
MTRRLAFATAVSALLAGCSFAPPYHVPTSVAPVAAFKSDPGWVPSQPSDAVAKGAWWQLFGDDALDALETRVAITNQNLAYYRANYAQALSVVRVDQAALLPTVGVTASGTRTGAISTHGPASSSFSAIGTASWEPDLWGALTNTKRAAAATAQATAAQLANATLSAQGTLATDYLELRGIDAQAAMLDTTLVSYRRSYDVTRNQYNAGRVSSADVDSARVTLANAEAQRRDLDRQRAADETAIAVLVGENPSAFTIPKLAWKPVVPDVPAVVPSSVLERRPDIANAERLASAANFNIGVERAAFFPAVSLTAQAGSTAGAIGSLFGAATSAWSLGASVAETLLDFGARNARVAGARAAYDAAVATYRQTVLNAFQEVEANLAGVAAYRAEQMHYAVASQAADRAEKVTLNEYRAGTVDFTTVTAAEVTAYQARSALIQNTVNQQTSAVAVIEAIGGQWTGTVDLNPSTKPPVAQ